MRMPESPSVTSEVIEATSAWVDLARRRRRRPMRFTGTRAKAKISEMPIVSFQSIDSMKPTVTTIVRMPVTPPSIERTAVPIRPMSEEKRAASPAGASVCSRARSDPTRRANIVLRSSVSIRLVTRLPVTSFQYWPMALAPLSTIDPERSPPEHARLLVLEGGHHQLDQLRVAAGRERDEPGHRQRDREQRQCGASQSRQSRHQGEALGEAGASGIGGSGRRRARRPAEPGVAWPGAATKRIRHFLPAAGPDNLRRHLSGACP